MVKELRIYYMVPGKMQAVKDRFRAYALNIFQPRHGIKVTDFWEDAEGKDILYYICEFDSVEAKDKAWKEFHDDPEWHEVAKKTEANGPLIERVETFMMKDTDFFKK